jgi:hypothetical protein
MGFVGERGENHPDDEDHYDNDQPIIGHEPF